MLDQEMLEIILSRAMQSEADFAEVFEEDTMSESISALNENVEKVDRSRRAGIGIRLYQGNRSVYGCSTECDKDSLLALVDELRDGFGRKETNTIVDLQKQTYPADAAVDPVEAPLQDKINLMKRAEQTAMAYDARIVKVQTAMANVRQTVQIANSTGRLVQDTRIRTRLMVHAYAQEDDRLRSGFHGPGAGKGLEFYEEATPEAIAKEACRVALVMLEAEECPSGRMPVIIDNGFGGVIFHEACGHSLEATAVAKHQSVFADKLGKQIANRCVTAIDDGTIPGAWGSQHVDDEGNPQQKRVLISHGILKSYMIDQLNGRRMGMPSTGSGRRQSYRYEPTSRMSNTYIAPGKSTMAEMLEGIEKGLYAKKMGGGSVNPQTGEFNFAVNEGYLIENGKITKPVRGASLIGTGAEILMNIDKVGANVARAQGMCGSVSGNIPVDVGQPTIRVSSITVGGTKSE